ncbi:CPBP family intramembrane glutamic endopeptidase [Porphyromonas macacae]|uniref:CPBP family intramembrane glutamic endopeptidase n=1 Tax=Porphyromonas macacae TaxID=28115 RepID=UPI00068C588C|nr:type II CAAX endopeptidase family protein [Porphyromonas macacae]
MKNETSTAFFDLSLLFFGTIAGLILAILTVPFVEKNTYLSIIAPTLLIFALPGFVYYAFARNKKVIKEKGIRPLNKSDIVLEILFYLLLFFAGLLIDFGISRILESMPYEWALAETKKAEETEFFIRKIMNDTSGWWYGIIALAVIPAISEELYFRYGVINVIDKFIQNKTATIWSVAVLFSLIHFSAIGFASRLTLGVIFGYLYYRTGSIKWPVFLHFSNNFFALLLI